MHTSYHYHRLINAIPGQFSGVGPTVLLCVYFFRVAVARTASNGISGFHSWKPCACSSSPLKRHLSHPSRLRPDQFAYNIQTDCVPVRVFFAFGQQWPMLTLAGGAVIVVAVFVNEALAVLRKWRRAGLRVAYP